MKIIYIAQNPIQNLVALLQAKHSLTLTKKLDLKQYALESPDVVITSGGSELLKEIQEKTPGFEFYNIWLHVQDTFEEIQFERYMHLEHLATSNESFFDFYKTKFHELVPIEQIEYRITQIRKHNFDKIVPSRM